MYKKEHLLFVCGMNRWRSPTAEAIYKNDPRFVVRSAGLSSKSRHPLSADDLSWAHLVFVMESEQKVQIRQLFKAKQIPKIISLDIPDEFAYMDEELVELIKQGVETYLQTRL